MKIFLTREKQKIHIIKNYKLRNVLKKSLSN
jgi:hypothetical protein